MKQPFKAALKYIPMLHSSDKKSSITKNEQKVGADL